MTKDLGIRGEAMALKKIMSLGYKILVQNFRCKLGEIDLIAIDQDTLVFIEVRSKSNGKYGLPQETVNTKKQRKLRQVAEFYLMKNNLYHMYCRFDVIGIVWQQGDELEIEIIKDAF